MAFDDPIWLQDVDYAARLDRGLIEAFGSEGVVYATDGNLKVRQRAAGANYSVDLDIGRVIVAGDDQPTQGSYFGHNKATLNVPMDAPPGSNSRIDLVIVRIYDTQAGGASPPTTGAYINAEIVKGDASASPVWPTVPASAYVLASVLIASGAPSYTDAMITDQRALARSHIVVSDTEPADPITGLVWFKPV